MASELEARIIELLESQRICAVATCADDRPLNSAVEYVNDGLTLYFVSFPDTQKVRNITANPEVAIAVSDTGLRPEEIRGLQYFGKARCLAGSEVDRARTIFLDRNLLDPATHWSRKRAVFVEVAPRRIDLIDYSKGIGHKETWTP